MISPAPQPPSTNLRPALWFTLPAGLLILALAGWLRWRYAQTVSPHVDEYITLWAARQTLELGLPHLPSGVIYPRGLPVSYLIAAAGSVTGVTLGVGRLVNLLFGVGAVGLVLLIGWRLWGWRAGLLAALGLALTPEAVQWGGSARFYAPMQFFALLTVWSGYWVVRWGDQPEAAGQLLMRGLLFATAFGLGLFAQEVIVLFYPALVALLIYWRGWRFLGRGPVLISQLLCLLAIGGRLLIDLVGQPGQLAAFQSNRPYLSLTLDIAGAWKVYGPLLVGPDRLLWAVGVALALIWAAVALWRVRGDAKRLPLTMEAMLYFALPTLFVLGLLLTVAGGEWREVRFFLALQPMLLLVGAAGLIALIDQLLPAPWLGGLVLAVLALVVIALQWEPLRQTLTERGNGLDAALAYVAANRQPGDLVLTSQPSACAFVVGHCSYYARQTGYGPYVLRRGDAVIDRYTGLPLLADLAQLEEILQHAPVVWFVIDRDSLTSSRYTADFLRLVVEHFELPFSERGGFALRATGWRAGPAISTRTPLDPPATYGPLQLTHWERSSARPGEPLAVNLFWQTSQRLGEQINSSVQVIGPDGGVIVQADSPIAQGFLALEPDTELPLPDSKQLALPATTAPGRYRIDTIAYGATTALPLAEQPLALDWLWIGPPPPTPAVTATVDWRNGLRLLGHSQLPAQLPAALSIQLQWTSTQPLTLAYTTFAHLVGPDGALVGQDDHQPEQGFFPTWGWDLGEPVNDTVQIILPPDLPSGPYQLVIGWYDAATGERIQLADGADGWVLGRWVKP